MKYKKRLSKRWKRQNEYDAMVKSDPGYAKSNKRPGSVNK